MKKKSLLARYDSLIFAFILLSAITAIVYSNSMDASWHMDDYPNIVNNPHIRIDNIYPETLRQTMYAAHDNGAYSGKYLFRPLPMLSFGLNWYWGQADVFGYHVVNICIHILSGWFLYLCILTLIKTPKSAPEYQAHAHNIALLAALFWVIHPINTQAVTYIVQRMAACAGLFFIAGLYAYLKARLSESLSSRWVYLGFSLLSFLLAVASKENAIIFPLVIFLVEVIFFRSISVGIKRRKLLYVLIGGSSIALVLFFIVFDINPLAVLNGYEKRAYTPYQRLVTEARVIFLYIYQLIYPVTENYSLVHDIDISTSLLAPWTSLAAVLGVIAIIAVAIIQIDRFPVLCFSILFFFVTHIIESTIIPLEIVFEHRNYLPSMFFFLPLSILIATRLNHRKSHGKRLYLLTITGTVLIIWTMGLSTYSRNLDWKSPKTLWEDAIRKAPDRARPYHSLANKYYSKIGEYDKAIALLGQSIGLKSDKKGYSDMVSYDNISLNLYRKGQLETAVKYSAKAVNSFPQSDPARMNYVIALTAANHLETALIQLKIIEKKSPNHIEVLNQKSKILLKLGRPDQAKDSVYKAIKSDPFNHRAIKFFGFYHFAVQNYDAADYYIGKDISAANRKNRIYYYLALIENSLRAGWQEKAVTYTKALLSDIAVVKVFAGIDSMRSQPHMEISLSFDLLSDHIRSALP